MKPHPRIRKTVKWGGAVVTALLVVVWIGSGWWFVSFATANGPVGFVGCGAIGVISEKITGRNALIGVHIVRPEDIGENQFYWWFGGGTSQGIWSYYLPIWLVAFLSLIASAIARRLDAIARARLNLCPKCNYDRTGLRGGAGAVCPECGAARIS